MVPGVPFMIRSLKNILLTNTPSSNFSPQKTVWKHLETENQIKNDKTSEFSNPWTVFRLIIFRTKHRIPPSPNGSRFSRKVTGCSNHWFEWQSNVYLVGISRKNWWSPGPVKKFVVVLVNGKKCVWNRCALIRERDEKLWDYEKNGTAMVSCAKMTR